ncbi:archaeosortase/exosortase family protein [Geobacter argillaceus]|uniref:Exosortase/archaeosortase family protein n=1 Tax=Geobacter argillaceus TaxID=345631 RepID=A0A562VFQ8_9BACT|nr:archaeosortase/exosortase family protein [Geobacter argillaceus]TWJ16688.1 exosortase/archaeosortase family protein [Geobacter argillaceus]
MQSTAEVTGVTESRVSEGRATTRRFALICILLLLAAVWLEPYLGPLNRLTARQVGSLLQFLDLSPRVENDFITIGSFTVRIIPECTPLYPVVLFGAFVLATPAPLLNRVAGVLCGGALLAAVNLARIAAVTVVGAKYPRLFELLHLYLGQLVMLLLVVATGIAWLRWAEASEAAGRIRFLLRALLSGSLFFLPWLILNRSYLRAIDRFVAAMFRLADYELIISYQHVAYYQTFNIVLFAALLIAENRVRWRLRMFWGCWGGVVLFGGHLLFRICNVLLVAFDWQPALQLSFLVSIVGQYFLPVLLWMALNRYEAVRNPAPAASADSISCI